MVISCPECSTRFRVDEGKIPAQGAKIRCARCKHIFAVSPPSPEPETLIEEAAPPIGSLLQPPDEPEITDELSQPEEANSINDSAESEATETDEGFGFNDIKSPEIGGGVNDELDPSIFGDDETVDDDAFSFSSDYGNVSLDDEPDENEDEPFSFGDPLPTEAPSTEEAEEQEQFSFTPAESTSTSESSVSIPDSIDEDSSLSDISMPPSEEEFSLNDANTPAPLQTSKASSRSLTSIILLLLLTLLLVILIGGGYIMWQSGPAGIEQIISNLTGQPISVETKGDIRLSNLQGSFITNKKEGELFVIHGIAINNLSEAQAAIQVKGVIFDKEGKQLLQKTIFCGNPISDDDLRKLPYSKMEEIMGNQFGESLANLNVTPKQSIPFTIVFRKLPKTLSEFVVEIADTKPAAQ